MVPSRSGILHDAILDLLEIPERGQIRFGAEETLEKLQNLSQEKYISAFFSAHTYVGLGQYDLALDCLEQACEERFHRAATIKVDPSFDPLHPDPRFQKLLKRMGLATGMKRVRKTSAS